MSDLLIRGIEMPKDGHWGTVSIPFYIHGDGSVSDSKGHVIGSAVPVPPHGDLVDRAEIREIAVSLLDKAVTDQEANAIREMWSHLWQMPVFIPAEEVKEL